MGTTRNKVISIAAIAAITIAGLMFAIRPGSDGQEIDTANPGVVLENVELLGSSKGIHRWKLTARTVRQESELVYLDHIDQLVLLEEGRPQYYIYADSGVWSPRDNRLHLYSNVVVDDGSGFDLNTDELVWDGERELMEFMGNISMNVNKGEKADE
ncbi:MAG: LPS export ABC transporter periplasmic protein LptC [Firmicutes bacterium]|jgi:hypothetical protein|nr:LPS export ABC transporter periplasmic protein LptC [Bacillota bacterium]NLL87953.1 LPS export ABC transporter periplasmic protein LptC [Bacillota bacterium]HKM18261.1 LPS export ABC transporter periplasmic protein LptC [Limnochordia bacterium]